MSKTITVTLTDEEIDVLEDMLWCQMSKEALENNYDIRSSLWTKIITEYDEEDVNNDQLSSSKLKEETEK